ncbi:MAG: 2OG-Fe(II) oxygenase [Sphingosinicella sp.]|nr:2OG-Fe(II) oxygenase [Sphingosinicella sp.]
MRPDAILMIEAPGWPAEVSGASMSIVNTALYPLSDKTRRAEIVANAARQLDKDGAAAFPAFVTPEALADMVAEASARFDRAYRRDQRLGFNPQGPLAKVADEALLKRASPYSMWILGSDLLDDGGTLCTLYRSPELMTLAQEALGIERLHVTVDPLINVNVTYMGEGDQHGWHFDDNDFVVSLLLQAAETGGAFEYAPEVDTAPVEDIHAILDGNSSRTRLQKVEAGTLLLFRGRKALHRVTEVAGGKHRIIALLSYHTEPGFVYADEVKKNGLGRISAIAA